MRRRLVVGVALVVGALGAAALAWGIADSAPLDAAAAQEESAAVAPTTAAVRRGILSDEHEFAASVSFGTPWDVTTAAQGTITDTTARGSVVGFGDTLITIDNRPLVLVEGSMPLYRELYEVDTRRRGPDGKRLTRQEGLDVLQLQRFLLAAGYDAEGELEADGIFGKSTKTAVTDWQSDHNWPATGRIDTTQLIFSPVPLRVASELRIGAPFGALEVTAADAKVLVDTSNRDRGALTVGAEVDVELSDGTQLTGSVADQEQLTGADGSRFWRTTITPDSTPPSDLSTAEVTVTEVVAEDALIVPVGALLAVANGGFAIEVTDATGTRLVAVDVGEVLDGQAAVTGDIQEGDEVVVAK